MLHDVIQVLPQKDFTVYVFFSDGQIKLYNMKPFMKKGIFQKISDIDIFISSCTVMNHTLAWDISGDFNPYKCIDIDPETIYMEGLSVRDPFTKTA